MEILNVGVDVAFWEESKPVFQGKYPNNHKGFQTIAQKIEAKCQETDTTSVFVVMEPTGGYEQPFARFAIQCDWKLIPT
jgi:transposase